MQYNLDDKPGFLKLIIYGLQWFIVAIPSIIVIGLVIAEMHGYDTPDRILYLQKLFAIVGVFTIVQVLIGHRLPLIIGPASVLLIGIVAASGADETAIYTSILIGGALLAIFSFSGILSRMNKFFTPRIVSVILLLIAITLIPVILNMVFSSGDDPLFHLLFTLGMVVLMLLGNSFTKGIWRSMVLLFAIIFGSLFYYLFMGFPAELSTAGASSTPTAPLFFLSFKFDIGVILSFFFCYIALTINELGSIQAVGYLLEAKHMDKRIAKGCGYTGISNMFSGLMGVIGTVDFSMTPGVIAATGCASRYTMVPMGVLMILVAFMPFLVQSLLYLPGAAMGAIFFYLMATQLGSGLQMMVKDKAANSFNSSITIALPLMIALFVVFMPAAVINSIPSLIRPIVGNGFVMGVITVFLLEHGLFRKKETDAAK